MSKLLPYNEWYKLEGPVKKCFGPDKEVPPPEVAPYCAVEEDDEGNITGFLFLQLVPHLEPFGSLGGVSFSKLKSEIDLALTNVPNMQYYVYVTNPEHEAVLVNKGFKVMGTMLMGGRG